MLNRLDIRILVYPELLQNPNEANVPCHEFLQRIHSLLGNVRSLDTAYRLPQSGNLTLCKLLGKSSAC